MSLHDQPGQTQRNPGAFSTSFLGKMGLFSGVLIALMGIAWYQILVSVEIEHPVGQGYPAFPVDTRAGEPIRILVLNSYHDGYSWSDNEMLGIVERLGELATHSAPIIEYLDCKHFSTAEHFPHLIELLQKKYAGQKFSLIIAADNPALDFATRFRADLFPGVPVVFCGVNGFDPAMVAGQEGITGVAEILDAGSTVDLALQLHPETRELLVIHDYTVTGRSTRRETEGQLGRFAGKVRIRYLEDLSREDLCRTLQNLKPGTIVLALSYSLDRSGNVYDHRQIASLLGSQSPVPVYALHEERVGYGVVGGHVLGGKNQGRRAAEIGVGILEGKLPASLAVDLNSPAFWMFDYHRLARFQIPLTRLPPDSVVVNLPVSFFRRHQAQVLAIAGVVAALVFGIISLATNILRRKVAENALALSEGKFRLLFESAVDLIFILSPDGRIRQANAQAGRMLGYSPGEFQNQRIDQLVPAGQAESILERISRPAGQGPTPFETTLARKDGSELLFEISGTQVEFEDGPALILTARDLSERKKAESARTRLQEDLSQAQKMESIGYLAGGIAHDFNNILTSIIGYAELAAKFLPPDTPGRKHLQNIKIAGEKAAGLTRQLLAFSRKQALHVKVLDLREVIQEMGGIFRRILREDIELKVIEGGPLKNVLADRTQVEQILLNLVVNARDAMPNGGRLLIEVGMADKQQRTSFERSGEFVMLAVSDNGIGIPPEVQPKIFEPFFTTKEVGKGTGLGLATVFGIVKQHSGNIEFCSEPGQGTTFRVYLPATDSPTAEPDNPTAEPDRPTAETHLPKPEPPRGHETILVVDDDPTIGNLIRDTLSPLGYTLLVGSTAQEAIELAEGHQGVIDVLLTDVIMPVINGKKLAEILQARYPALRVIYMSGYTDDIIAPHGILDPGVELIQKPISPTDLARTLRTLIG